jgi:hypothetical protein
MMSLTHEEVEEVREMIREEVHKMFRDEGFLLLLVSKLSAVKVKAMTGSETKRLMGTSAEDKLNEVIKK